MNRPCPDPVTAENERLRKALEAEINECEARVARSRAERTERESKRVEEAKRQGWEFGQSLPEQSRRAEVYDAWHAGHSLANGATAERLRAVLTPEQLRGEH